MSKRISIVVISLFVAVATSLAIHSTPAVAQLQTTKEPIVSESQCALATTKLAAQLTKIEAVKTSQTAVYLSISAKVDALVISAGNNSYDDIGVLTTARDDTRTKVTSYNEKAIAYASALTGATALECGSGTGAFVIAVKSARTALADARIASLAVKTSIKDTLILALKDYAAWLKSQAADTSRETK